MLNRKACNLIISFASTVAALTPLAAPAGGPDVITGQVVQGRQDSRLGSKIGLTAATNSCNIGDGPLSWYPLDPQNPPAGSNRHPAISLNFYRLMDGRMEQLARSWVKHGFYATNANECKNFPENKQTCQSPGLGGNQLRPGCSDYYSEDLNADPDHLGPRSRINNATTAIFDAATAQDLTGYPPSQPPERILLVEESDLQQANARYFIEGHYLHLDDAAAGNSRNNATYQEVTPIFRGGRWDLVPVRSEVRMQPAITAWQDDGAKLTEVETDEGAGAKSYVIVASKVNSAPGGKFRYDYAVYNMNSELAIQSLSVPASGVDQASIGFKAVPANGEIWSNQPWESKVQNGQLIWSTKKYNEDQNANALRWGSTYNFWFVSSAAPGNGSATLTRFKPPSGAVSPSFAVGVSVPGGAAKK
jgi:hypothetical protein